MFVYFFGNTKTSNLSKNLGNDYVGTKENEKHILYNLSAKERINDGPFMSDVHRIHFFLFFVYIGRC